MKDQVNIHDLYMRYRYLYRDVNSNKVFQPYVPKERISNHPFKLTIAQWRDILRTYMDVLAEKLMTGRPVKLPWSLGTIRLCRYKPVNNKPWYDGKIYHNWHTDGWRPVLIWYKKKSANFKYKFIYRMVLPGRIWDKIKSSLIEDSSLIYKLPDKQSRLKPKIDHAI